MEHQATITQTQAGWAIALPPTAAEALGLTDGVQLVGQVQSGQVTLTRSHRRPRPPITEVIGEMVERKDDAWDIDLLPEEWPD